MSKISPTILLLGGGYTLSRLANELPAGTFLITTTTVAKHERYCANGWNSILLDLKNETQVRKIFSEYPDLKTVIDSVPPLKEEFAGKDKSLVGAHNISKAMKENFEGDLIYLSTTGVYGKNDGSWVDETTELSPNNPSSKARVETERLYRDAIRNFCVFRLPAIYGPGRGLGNAIKSGRYPVISDFDRWSNRIHVDDLCAALLNAITKKVELRLPEIVCCADDKPTLTSDIISFYVDNFGYTAPAKITLEEARKAGMHSILSSQRVSNSLLKERLLPELRFPSYREAAFLEIF